MKDTLKPKVKQDFFAGKQIVYILGETVRVLKIEKLLEKQYKSPRYQ